MTTIKQSVSPFCLENCSIMESAFTKHHIRASQSLVKCVQRLSTNREMDKVTAFDWLHANIKFR